MIPDIAARRAQLSPQRTAVIFRERAYTYGELNGRAERLAAGLQAAGVRKGDRVAILAQNHIAHIDLMMATAKAGFIHTPFNYRLSRAEQLDLARYVRPAFVLADEERLPVAESIAAELGSGLLRLAGFEQWLEQAPAQANPVPLSPEDTQMILFTGGTTGTPKGAMLPYRQGFYNAVNTVLSWGLRDDDRVIQATPCFHAAVNAFTTPLLHLGATVILQDSFEPGEYLDLAASHRATILFLVPTMYRMLADHEGFAGADLSAVRWAISGGAPCPAAVRQRFTDRGIRFRQGYGMTEAGVNCFAIELDVAQKKPTSVGSPVLHAQAVVRDEAGQPVPPGEVGELTLRGPHLFSGYFERPQATEEVLRDGWLWTGDLARQDEDGHFHLVGRRKEMFISGGENVFPAEVEAHLEEHPLVSECCVVGVPDERWGEVGLAAVVIDESALPAGEDGKERVAQELREHLRKNLARYKVPKRFLFLPELPKSGAGKVLKREIAQLGKETV
mgnify:CR=1 FL=1